MSGSETKMLEEMNERDPSFVDRAIAEIVTVSERYYSLELLPPTSSPAFLRGRVGGAVNVEGKADIRIGGLSQAAQESVADDSASTSGLRSNFSANLGGPYDEVTAAGGPGASIEREVVRRAHDEIVVEDSANSPTDGRHASDESLNKDSA
jgi:hypothetical protein